MEVCSADPSLAETFDVYYYNHFSLPSFALRFLESKVSNFEAKEDDIYLVSYPKTGTTWAQELVYIINSDLNFSAAKSTPLNERFPYLEMLDLEDTRVENMPSPRYIKTHFPYSLLPSSILEKKCKLVYITRNPKDVVVSYYHFARMLRKTAYKGTFAQFFERFLQNRPTYSPFWKHNLEFWEHHNDPNVLFLHYEDLYTDPRAGVKEIASFFGKILSEEEIEKVIDHCSFNNMSKNPSTSQIDQENSAERIVGESKFFRKGKVGDWKSYFTEEMDQRMNQWIENHFRKSGLTFTYSLD
ncbi:sulfotransferase 1C4-like isoform X1 [Limulus polyphemus]|uniref:Sulfotransferase 1C4-like isoform X1 n=1 Tax=Limulus polyphemus TaxID=6850 RepID=A0ABM1B075_LIMPO|nr:sulfotransferase 1C4-like isoform X1 [Limulus polyphemus]